MLLQHCSNIFSKQFHIRRGVEIYWYFGLYQEALKYCSQKDEKVIVRTVNATNSFWLCKALRTQREGAPEMSLFKFSSYKRTCKMLQFNLLSLLCYVHWKATKNGKYKKIRTNFLFHLKNYPIWGFIVHTRSKTLPHNHFTGSNLFRGQKIRPLWIL